ncbi:hypothetical protein EV13_2102 [Prochlorococcus sp. MIT 0702]|nr:hypothetical protein EV13_2102 [Prochlorococcus sp. MIT 0702]
MSGYFSDTIDERLTRRRKQYRRTTHLLLGEASLLLVQPFVKYVFSEIVPSDKQVCVLH